MDSISTDNIKFVSNGGEAGLVMEVTCPNCGYRVNVSVGGMGWWEQTCKCGYEWSIVAKGTKQE